ncbi:MAG: hypothetical protein Q9183_002810 [Haloplaca sp. 2 TL-2023]
MLLQFESSEAERRFKDPNATQITRFSQQGIYQDAFLDKIVALEELGICQMRRYPHNVIDQICAIQKPELLIGGRTIWAPTNIVEVNSSGEQCIHVGCSSRPRWIHLGKSYRLCPPISVNIWIVEARFIYDCLNVSRSSSIGCGLPTIIEKMSQLMDPQM